MNAQTEKRISELLHAQEIELGNNFPNGNLWNEIEGKIWNLKNYGQEQDLEKILDEDGNHIGDRFLNGRELYHEGMNIYNSGN